MASVVLLVLTSAAFPVWFWDTGNWLDPWGFVAFDSVIPHPFVFLAMALLALGGLVAVTARRTGTRIVAAFVAVFAGGLVALAGAGISVVLFDSRDPTSYSVAPGGRLEVVVARGTEFQGPTWTLTARTRDGLLSRQHHVAFLEGDNPDCGFAGLSWVDGETVRVTLGSGRTYDFRFDPDAVPDRTLSGLYPC